MEDWTEREQKLADICVQLVLGYRDNEEFFNLKSTEQVAEWVSDQLNKCGFYNVPLGSKWVYLTSKEHYKEHYEK